MNSNTPPTPRGNQSTSSGSPQETPNVGFQQFQQTPYFPQQTPNVGFQQLQQNPYYPQYAPNVGFPQSIHPLSREGMILQGWAPGNFHLPQPAFNTGINLEEIVPETPHTISTQQSSPDRQPSPTPNPSPQKKKFEKRAARQSWTRAEEMALASAWIDISEDPNTGNAQSRDSFWGRIEKRFYMLMCREKYRTHHQLSTKYTELNKKVQQFAGIYNNLYNSRSSGSSEADILKAAHVRYENEYQAAFNHQQVWDILKLSPKWNTVPTMTNTSRGSKRTHTSDEDAEVERPIGRNKAKKAATSSTDHNRYYSELSDLRSKIDDTFDYKMKKLELEQQKCEIEQKKCEIELERQYEKDFEFFLAPHDHLTGAALQVTLARKERIRQKHNWNF